jgi:hypothetical protein
MKRITAALFFFTLLSSSQDAHAQICHVPRCDGHCDRFFCTTVNYKKVCNFTSFNACLTAEEFCRRLDPVGKARLACQTGPLYQHELIALRQARSAGQITNMAMCEDASAVAAASGKLAGTITKTCGCFACREVFEERL